MYFDKCDIYEIGIEERGIQSAALINLTIKSTIVRQSLNTRFSMQTTGFAAMTIYNSAGLRQKDVFRGILQKGPHDMTVTTSDLPAGVYFLSLQTPEWKGKAKFIVTR